MNKKELFKIFDLASFISLIIATISVIIFEIIGTYFYIKFALIMYTAALLTLSVLFAMKLYFSTKKDENKDEMFVLDKKQLGLLIAKLVISVIVFIFTLVVLIIF